MFNKILKYIHKKEFIGLFTLLLSSFVFGSNLLSLSLGFLTIYPHLILTFILSVIGIFHIKNIKTPLEKYFLSFLLIWLLYSLFQLIGIEGKSDAKIDIRSITLMLLNSWILIWVKNFLGFNTWKKTISNVFFIVFSLLLFFSLFEIATGIHFTGAFTQKIIDNDYRQLIYTPIFLFDNPNTLSTYIFLVIAVLLMTTKEIKTKYFLIATFILTMIFIANITLSRIGVALTKFMFFWLLILYIPTFYNYIKSKGNKRFKISLVYVVIVMTLIYTTKDKYYGPIWIAQQNKTSDQTLKNIAKQFSINLLKHNNDSNAELAELQAQFEKDNKYAYTFDFMHYLNQDSVDSLYNSKKVRIALLLNGLEIIKENKFKGIGPGQYRYKGRNNDKKYYTKTIISPHFWLMEIISQYGIVIFSMYIFLFLWIVFLLMKNFKKDYFFSGLIFSGIIVFIGSSAVPSSFLILDINWMYMAILVGIISQFNQKTE